MLRILSTRQTVANIGLQPWVAIHA